MTKGTKADAAENGVVRTSEITVRHDYAAIDSLYDLFEVDLDHDHRNRILKAADETFTDHQICSVRYQYDGPMLVMLKRDSGNDLLMEEFISGTGSTAGYRRVNPSSVSDRDLTQLLLNALCRSDCIYRYNNTTGRMLFHNPGWKNDSRHRTFLEMRIENDPTDCSGSRRLYITANVRTMSNLRIRDVRENITLKKGKTLDSYPHYSIDKLGQVHRDDKGSFIERVENGFQKNELEFLSMFNIRSFGKCKAKAIETVIDDYNDRFGYGEYGERISEISLREIADSATLRMDNNAKKDLHDRIESMLRRLDVRIVDTIGTDESKACVDKITGIVRDGKYFWKPESQRPQSAMKKDYESRGYGVTLKTSDTVEEVPGRAYIILVRPSEQYNEDNDPHRVYRNIAVQHIEDVSLADKGEDDRNSWTEVDASLKELCIKQDIIDGTISMDDWGAYGFEEPVSFVSRIQGTDRLVSLTIGCDGSTDYRAFDIGDAPDDFSECRRKFTPIDQRRNVSRDGNEPECLIYCGDQVLEIVLTPAFGMPDIIGIEEFLNDSVGVHKGIKSRDFMETHYKSCVDAHMWKEDGGEVCYSVGIPFRDLTGYAILKSALIRRVKSVKPGKNVDLSKLKSLLLTAFVRYRQLTVLPYPIKYIRAYAEMNDISKSELEETKQ